VGRRTPERRECERTGTSQSPEHARRVEAGDGAEGAGVDEVRLGGKVLPYPVRLT
jgi:hypothetical protein